MLEKDLNELLKKSFHNKFSLVKRREDIYQLIVPLFHEDGDMMDIFIKTSDTALIVCDCGMTLMRLSYTFEVDSEHKEKVLFEIIAQNGAKYTNGNIFIETTPEMLFRNIMQLSQVISKVSSMKMLRQSNVVSVFYENVQKYIYSSLLQYTPQKNYLPIEGKDEYSVDYYLKVNKKPAYVFAVNSEEKALVSTVAVMEFQKHNLPFTGIAISNNLADLTRKNQKRMISAMDKVFYDYDDFEENSSDYFRRLAS